MINNIQDLAFLTGIVLGSIQLLAVSWVWIRKQVLGTGGVMMSFVGIVLVGLALWSSVKIQASPDGGILAEFERELQQINDTVDGVENRVEEVDSNLQNVVSTSLSLNRDIEALNTSVAANSRQFVELTNQLEQSSSLNNLRLDNLRQGVQVPEVQESELRLRRETLEGIRNSLLTPIR